MNPKNSSRDPTDSDHDFDIELYAEWSDAVERPLHRMAILLAILAAIAQLLLRAPAMRPLLSDVYRIGLAHPETVCRFGPDAVFANGSAPML